MKTGPWIPAIAVMALMAGACGPPAAGNTTSATRISPSAPTSTPTGTPLPPQQGLCKAPSNRCLALVTLRGSSSFVVRDITDIAHPRTVSNLGKIPAPSFVSATELSYAVDGSLYRVPLSGSPKTLVNSQAGAGTWNPAGSAVVYTTEIDPETITVHQWRAGRDQVLGSIPGGGGGGCETIASCQIPNFLDFRLLYSPDGTMISLVTSAFTGSHFRVWSSDGNLITSSDLQGTTMSAWSGTSLYFRDAKGVQVWHGGVISSFMPGVAWVKPMGSPDGRHIVYVSRDSGGWSHTYVVDTATRDVRELKKARSEPVAFLTARFVWYEGERACVPLDACGSHPPFHPSNGKTYIYDLETGTETESIITSVADVWPRAA